jgi:hypothetical protein
VQRRAHGELADDEIGADLAASPSRALNLAARSSYDLASPGIAEALASAALHASPAWRLEAFATHRSPSRLVPATSLFSVLGDFPSERIGGTLLWKAAPRLDLFASGDARLVGGEVGSDASARALLRLDDLGDGAVGLEARRQDVTDARFTGVRATGVRPLGAGFRASTELELAVPDAPRGRGAAWPWALVALAWRSASGWEAAAAVEAAATPAHAFEANALARLSRTLELGR